MGSGSAVDALRAWLSANGARVAPIEVVPSPEGGRSVRAGRPLAAGARILHVPLRCVITGDVARASEVGRALDRAGASFRNDQSYLAAFILEERRARGSFWRAYIDALPARHDGMPALFGPDGLALLRGSCALDRIRRQRASIAHDHRELVRCVPALARHALADFAWARFSVVTRVFALTAGDAKTEGLVPMADMLDHAEPCEATWAVDAEAGAFAMTMARAVPAGAPIRDSYGRKCNSRFFVSYGFCLDDNPDNEAALRIAPPALDRRLARRAAAFGDPRRGHQRFRIPARADADGARDLLSFLRLACAEGPELHAIGDDGPIGPIGTRNELAALAVVEVACRKALADFETTLEEDLALLDAGGLARDARNCVIVRSGEKRVLRAWLGLAEAASARLRGARGAPIPRGFEGYEAAVIGPLLAALTP